MSTEQEPNQTIVKSESSTSNFGVIGLPSSPSKPDLKEEPKTVEAIQASFHKPHTNIVKPGRVLLKEGPVTRSAALGRAVERHIFLFNDLLVLAEALKKKKGEEQKYEQKQIVDLANAKLEKEGSKPNSFRVVVPNEKPLIFLTKSAEVRDDWVRAVQVQMEETVQAHAVAETAATTSSAEAPTTNAAEVPPSGEGSPSPRDASPSPRADVVGEPGEATKEESPAPQSTEDVKAVEAPPIIIEEVKEVLCSIHEAVSKGDLELIQKVIDANNSDINAVGEETGMTPVQLATVNGNVEALQMLANNNATVPNTLIHMSAKYGRPEVLKFLIKYFQDKQQPLQLDSQDSDNYTPLWAACLSRVSTVESAVECIHLLVNAGANVNEANPQGDVLLHRLAEQHDDRAATIGTALLEHNPSVDATNIVSGRTPLHYASRTGFVRFMQLLLFAGAFPNKRDASLDTPLHLVNTHQDATLLIAHGSRVQLKNKNGKRAVESLLATGDVKVAQALRTAETKYQERSTIAGDRAPIEEVHWVDDSAYNECPLCSEPFTVLFRRHHCRRCGNLVCNDCSEKEFSFNSKDNRCCDSCYNVLLGKNIEKQVPQAQAQVQAEAQGQPQEQKQAEPVESPEQKQAEPAESTESPKQQPTQSPKQQPTQSPTQSPKQQPTQSPKQQPSQSPTQSPKQQPTQSPKQQPTQSPKQQPTQSPKQQPTQSSEPEKIALPEPAEAAPM